MSAQTTRHAAVAILATTASLWLRAREQRLPSSPAPSASPTRLPR